MGRIVTFKMAPIFHLFSILYKEKGDVGGVGWLRCSITSMTPMGHEPCTVVCILLPWGFQKHKCFMPLSLRICTKSHVYIASINRDGRMNTTCPALFFVFIGVLLLNKKNVFVFAVNTRITLYYMTACHSRYFYLRSQGEKESWGRTSKIPSYHRKRANNFQVTRPHSTTNPQVALMYCNNPRISNRIQFKYTQDWEM